MHGPPDADGQGDSQGQQVRQGGRFAGAVQLADHQFQGHAAAAQTGRTGKVDGMGHKAPLLVWELGTKKGKATLPGLTEPPGPHGLPDVALPNMNLRPERRAEARIEKSALFTVWGTAKATDTPLLVRGFFSTSPGFPLSTRDGHGPGGLIG